MAKKGKAELPLPKSLQAVLAAMTEQERNLFGQYLQFEPFNAQQKLHTLYELVLRHYFSARPPAKAWEGSLQEAGLNPSQMDKMLSFLYQRLDQFLAFQRVLQAPHRYQPFVIEAYAQLKVDYDTTEKRWRQLVKKLKSEPFSTEHSHALLVLEHEAAKTRIGANILVEGSYFAETQLLLDLQYLVNKLKYTCAAINEAQMLKRPFPTELVDQVRGLLNLYPYEKNAFSMAYETVFQMLVDPEIPVEGYRRKLQILIDCAPEIADEDNFDLFNYLLNQCYRRVEVAKMDYEGLMVDIYRQLIDRRLLISNGEMPGRAFRNIISLNCRQGNFDWSRQFITDHKDLLAKEERTVLPLLSKGMVDFYEGKYTQAVTVFKEVIALNHEDHYWGFDCRAFLLKSYFHLHHVLNLHEQEELYNLIDSFRMYVRRHSQINSYHQKSYLNFLKYFALILKHHEQHANKPIQDKFLQALQKETIVYNKPWLLAQFSIGDHPKV